MTDEPAKRGRPPATVTVVVMCPNIHTSIGKLLFRQKAELPRAEVETYAKWDREAGREERLMVL